MGLVTAVTSWRWGYATAALAAACVLVVLWIRLDRTDERPRPAPAVETDRSSATSASGRSRVDGMAGGAHRARRCWRRAKSLFVTFGPWLQDEFDVGDAVLAAATFGLGGVELAASGLSMTRTDRWGKERSVIGGAVVMIVAALCFLAVNQWALPGMVLVVVFIGASSSRSSASSRSPATSCPGCPAAASAC